MIVSQRVRTSRAQSRGLGDGTTSIVGTVASVGGTAASIAGAAAGAGLLSLGLATSFVPFVGPVLALGAVIFSIFHNSKSAQEKVQTTQVVNQIEPYMKQNVAAWQASDKSCSNQQAALANFDTLWQQVVTQCGQVGDDPGKNCVSDRTRGGKWDWYSYYRDPIANDSCSNVTNAASVVNGASDLVGVIGSATGLSTTEIVLGAVALGLVLIL